jgi:hypothetical protein
MSKWKIHLSLVPTMESRAERLDLTNQGVETAIANADFALVKAIENGPSTS